MEDFNPQKTQNEASIDFDEKLQEEINALETMLEENSKRKASRIPDWLRVSKALSIVSREPREVDCPEARIDGVVVDHPGQLYMCFD